MLSNPALSENTFSNAGYTEAANDVMTIKGSVYKSGALLVLTAAAGTWTWSMTKDAGLASAAPWAIGGLIGGLVFALITIFKPGASPGTAPLYAVCEGLLLGAISAIYDTAMTPKDGGTSMFSGIVFQAMALTMGTLGAMLILYVTRIIKVTERFRSIMFAAIGAIFFVYIINFALAMFGVNMPFLHEASPIGIGITLIIIGVAAFSLLLDFDLIETGAAQGAPKHMEWYAGFALLVTLVWLYIEFLRLLAMIAAMLGDD